LFVLKFTGLVTEGGYTLGAGHLSNSDRVARAARKRPRGRRKSPSSRPPRARRPRSNPGHRRCSIIRMITGSVGAKPRKKKTARTRTRKTPTRRTTRRCRQEGSRKADRAAAVSGRHVIPLEPQPVSAAERAILERLTERRQELDQRERELALRGNHAAGAGKSSSQVIE
jgi:hypothetical protein